MGVLLAARVEQSRPCPTAGPIGLPRTLEGAGSTSGLLRIRFTFPVGVRDADVRVVAVHREADRGADGHAVGTGGL